MAAGTARIRLPAGGLDLIGKIHFSQLLRSLETSTGHVTCRVCSGAGQVPLPRALVGLQSVFDFEFNLTSLAEHDRLIYLEQPCGPTVRERIKAERQAEADRKRDALRRSEAASFGVLPGTPSRELEELPDDRPQVRPDFIPARSG